MALRLLEPKLLGVVENDLNCWDSEKDFLKFSN